VVGVLLLEVARMIREIFLQQNAYHDVDSYCPITRQHALLSSIKRYSDLAYRALEGGTALATIGAARSRDLLAKCRFEKDFEPELKKVLALMDQEFSAMGK